MVVATWLARQPFGHGAQRYLFTAPPLDMSVVQNRADTLEYSPGRFRNLQPDRREHIPDQDAVDCVDRLGADLVEHVLFQGHEPGLAVAHVAPARRHRLVAVDRSFLE